MRAQFARDPGKRASPYQLLCHVGLRDEGNGRAGSCHRFLDHGRARRDRESPSCVLLGRFYRSAAWLGFGQNRGGGKGFGTTAAQLGNPRQDANQDLGSLFRISEAEILLQNQRSDEAIALLDWAAAEADATGQHYSKAEGFRVRACARLSQSASLAEVEALFQRGLATARRQNARLFELRTATSPAQVWRDVGRVDDARTLLAPIQGWFTSGHSTVDLIQARAVLDGLR